MSKNCATLCAFFLVAAIHVTTCKNGGGGVHVNTNLHLPSYYTGFNILWAILCTCFIGVICVCGSCVCSCLKSGHNKRMRRKAQTKQHLEQHGHHGIIVPIYSSSHVMHSATQQMDVCPMADRRVSLLPAHDVTNQPPIELDTQSLNVPIFADKDNRPLSKNDYC